MLMPSLFGENLLDDFFDMPRISSRGFTNSQKLMNTDVKDLGNAYEIAMDLPGFKKEDVQAELKDGYLTINATTNTSNDTKDDEGRFIRRERYSGSCSRSFYVGRQVKETDIKARFEDGVLKLDIPKVEAKPAVEDKHYIAIEG